MVLTEMYREKKVLIIMKSHSSFNLVRGNLLEGKMHLHCPYTAHARPDLIHSDLHSSKQQDVA